MDIQGILFHIDAELDRLKRARAVLTGEPLLAKKKRRKRSRGPASDPKPLPVVVDLKPEPSAPPVTRYPAKVFPKRALPRKSTLRKNEMEHKPTALRGSIPSGPIVVSAEEARQARARQDIDRSAGAIQLEKDPDQKHSLRTLIAKLDALSGAPKIFPQTENPYPSS